MRCLTSSAPVCTLEHLWPTANSPPDREANSTVDCQTPQALRASPPFRGAIALPPAPWRLAPGAQPSALGHWPSSSGPWPLALSPQIQGKPPDAGTFRSRVRRFGSVIGSATAPFERREEIVEVDEVQYRGAGDREEDAEDAEHVAADDDRDEDQQARDAERVPEELRL